MSEIVKMGTQRLLPGEVNTDLVEALDDLKRRAERGELTALAWAGVTGNRHLVTGWDGAGGTIFDLAAAIMTLHSRYGEFIREDRV